MAPDRVSMRSTNGFRGSHDVMAVALRTATNASVTAKLGSGPTEFATISSDEDD